MTLFLLPMFPLELPEREGGELSLPFAKSSPPFVQLNLPPFAPSETIKEPFLVLNKTKRKNVGLCRTRS